MRLTDIDQVRTPVFWTNLKEELEDQSFILQTFMKLLKSHPKHILVNPQITTLSDDFESIKDLLIDSSEREDRFSAHSSSTMLLDQIKIFDARDRFNNGIFHFAVRQPNTDMLDELLLLESLINNFLDWLADDIVDQNHYKHEISCLSQRNQVYMSAVECAAVNGKTDMLETCFQYDRVSQDGLYSVLNWTKKLDVKMERAKSDAKAESIMSDMSGLLIIKTASEEYLETAVKHPKTAVLVEHINEYHSVVEKRELLDSCIYYSRFFFGDKVNTQNIKNSITCMECLRKVPSLRALSADVLANVIKNDPGKKREATNILPYSLKYYFLNEHNLYLFPISPSDKKTIKNKVAQLHKWDKDLAILQRRVTSSLNILFAPLRQGRMCNLNSLVSVSALATIFFTTCLLRTLYQGRSIPGARVLAGLQICPVALLWFTMRFFIKVRYKSTKISDLIESDRRLIGEFIKKIELFEASSDSKIRLESRTHRAIASGQMKLPRLAMHLTEVRHLLAKSIRDAEHQISSLNIPDLYPECIDPENGDFTPNHDHVDKKNS